MLSHKNEGTPDDIAPDFPKLIMGLVIWSDVDTTTFDLFGLESEEPNTPSFITKFINVLFHPDSV